MKRHTFDEVLKLDQALNNLAVYEITKGMILVPQSIEELYRLQEDIANKFNYFKRQIQTGECSFEYIKQRVLDTYGPFPKQKVDINKLTEWVDEEDILNEFSFSPSNPLVKALVKMIDGVKEKGEDDGNDVDIIFNTLDDLASETNKTKETKETNKTEKKKKEKTDNESKDKE